MKRLKDIFIALMLFAFVHSVAGNPVPAHGNEKHESRMATKASEAAVHDTVKANPQQEHASDTVSPEDHASHLHDPATVHASLDDFPNRHPLQVHFPIVLMLVGAAVQLVNIFFMKRELDWVATIATAIGFGVAFYITRFDHPHTSDLTAHAELVLQQHDHYAGWTIYLGAASLVYLLLHLFLFKGKRWSVVVAALLLSGAAYQVAMAGHYGAQLVHIEGVGPEGKYLDTGHH